MSVSRGSVLHHAALASLLSLACASAVAQYVDNAGCVQCHQTAPQPNDFCSVTPAAVWSRDDKHKQAFFLLHESDPRDPQKGAEKRELVRRILGFDLREAFAGERYFRLKDAGGDADTARKVATVKACLRCHATWPKEADENYPRHAARFAGFGRVVSGLSWCGRKVGLAAPTGRLARRYASRKVVAGLCRLSLGGGQSAALRVVPRGGCGPGKIREARVVCGRASAAAQF